MKRIFYYFTPSKAMKPLRHKKLLSLKKLERKKQDNIMNESTMEEQETEDDD